jgi:hypothetical protein
MLRNNIKKNIYKALVTCEYKVLAFSTNLGHITNNAMWQTFEKKECAIFTRDILAHNIVIKRYRDKKYFEPWISMSSQGKHLMKHEVP